MSETKIINGLTYNIVTRYGECGADSNNKTLYFPFFLMGACGDDRGVISWDGKKERLIAPKKMNYKWFELLSKKLKDEPYFDWDWYSFSKNILKPNREHIKKELNINDEKVDLLLRDGYVFINNFNGSFEDDGLDTEKYVEGKNIGYYPNFKNFLEHDELEY